MDLTVRVDDSALIRSSGESQWRTQENRWSCEIHGENDHKNGLWIDVDREVATSTVKHDVPNEEERDSDFTHRFDGLLNFTSADRPDSCFHPRKPTIEHWRILRILRRKQQTMLLPDRNEDERTTPSRRIVL